MPDKKDKRGVKRGTPIEQKRVRWEYDILEKTFIPREVPRVVPAPAILDEPTYCIRFNALWMPHILGALELLLQKDSWSGGDNEIFRAQQNIYTMLANPTNCEGDVSVIPEFRSIVVDTNCDQLQWKYTHETEDMWRNIGTPLCDGQDGEDGAPGEDGQDGEPGAPGECDCDETTTVPEEITEPETGGNNCAGAFGLVEALLATLNYNLDELDFAGAVTSQLITVVSLGLKETFEAIPVVNVIISSLEFATTLGTGIIRGVVNNPTFKEAMVCALFCAVETEGAFNEASFNAWIGEIDAQYPFPNAGSAFVDLAKRVIPYANHSRKYAIEATNTDNRCEELCTCAEGPCYYWMGGFYLVGEDAYTTPIAHGVYPAPTVGANAICGSTTVNSRRGIAVKIDSGSGNVITEFDTEIRRNSPVGWTFYTRIYNDQTNEILYEDNAITRAKNDEDIHLYPNCQAVRIEAEGYSFPACNMSIDRIWIRTAIPLPDIEPNCPEEI